jgi:hypothetical protein
MFIEYKVKFGQDGVTVTQRIDFDASTVDQDEVASNPQTDDSETSAVTVAKENRLGHAAPLQPSVAPPEGGGPGDRTRGSGPGDRTRGSGPGDRTRGTGQGDSAPHSGLGDSTRGTGVFVFAPVIINCPPQHKA